MPQRYAHLATPAISCHQAIWDWPTPPPGLPSGRISVSSPVGCPVADPVWSHPGPRPTVELLPGNRPGPEHMEDPMTTLTHHSIASRTRVAIAFLVVALAGLIVALVLGIAATSGHSSGGQHGRVTDVQQPGCVCALSLSRQDASSPVTPGSS